MTHMSNYHNLGNRQFSLTHHLTRAANRHISQRICHVYKLTPPLILTLLLYHYHPSLVHTHALNPSRSYIYPSPPTHLPFSFSFPILLSFSDSLETQQWSFEPNCFGSNGESRILDSVNVSIDFAFMNDLVSFCGIHFHHNHHHLIINGGAEVRRGLRAGAEEATELHSGHAC